MEKSNKEIPKKVNTALTVFLAFGKYLPLLKLQSHFSTFLTNTTMILKIIHCLKMLNSKKPIKK